MIPPSAQLGMDNELAREIETLRKKLVAVQAIVDVAQKWGEAVVKLDDIDGGEDMDSYLTATDTLLNQLAAYNRVTSEAKQLTDA